MCFMGVGVHHCRCHVDGCQGRMRQCRFQQNAKNGDKAKHDKGGVSEGTPFHVCIVAYVYARSNRKGTQGIGNQSRLTVTRPLNAVTSGGLQDFVQFFSQNAQGIGFLEEAGQALSGKPLHGILFIIAAAKNNFNVGIQAA